MVEGNNVNIVIRAKDEFSRVFNNAKVSLKKFQSAGIIAGGAAVGLALAVKDSVNAGIELENAMVGVRKTTGASAEETEKLRQDFINLSKEMPVSAKGLASIGEVAGQLGIQGRDNIKNFTETVSKMSIATELSEENAALALAKISNAMGLPIEDSEKLGSAINELSNISAASSSEIVNAMVRVAGSANTLGLSTKNVTGMTAALIASGEPAERAGTKLRSAFDTVVKKMDSEVIPLMGEDFPNVLRTNADSAILSLITRISEIEDPIERQKTAMNIFGTVGASAINKLSNNIPEMNKLIESSSKEFENATSLQKEYSVASDSTANQIQLMKNKFQALQFEVADALIPILRDTLIPIIEKIIGWFSSLPEPVKQAIIVFTIVSIVIGGLAAVIALVTMVSSPWLFIILGIIAAITGIILVIQNWKSILLTLAKWMVRIGIEMRMVWEKFKDAWEVVWTGIKNFFIKIWNWIIDAIENNINGIINSLNSVITFMNKIPGVNIPIIPEINLSGIKGQIENLSNLDKTLEMERNQLRLKLETQADATIDALAEKIGFDEQSKEKGDTNINIENLNAQNPEEVQQALEEVLRDKIA